MSFPSADTPRLSSITPSPTIAVHVTSAASGSALPWFMSEKNGRTREAPRPTRNPRYIATPPIVGVALGCTLRSDGWSIAPNRKASRRTIGVATNVVPAQARKTQM